MTETTPADQRRQDDTLDTIDAFQAARAPEDVCRDEVSAAIWRAAELAVGQPPPGSDEWVAWKADPDAQREIHRQTIRFAHHVGLPLVGWVANARKAGVGWEEIGALTGRTAAEAEDLDARLYVPGGPRQAWRAEKTR